MDTCVIVGTSIQSFVLLVCVVVSLDCIRRQIPPTIAKFRLASIPFIALHVVNIATSGNPNFAVSGSVFCLTSALVLILILYFLENCAYTLIGLDLDIDPKALTRLVTSWSVARVVILVSLSVVAIIFPFDLTYRVIFARDVIYNVAQLICFVPLPFALLRICFELKKHRTAMESAQNEARPHIARMKQLRNVHWQLAVFAVVVLVLVVWNVISQSQSLAERATKLDEKFEDVSCAFTSPITPIVVLIVLYITRCPDAPLRSTMSNIDATRPPSRSKSSARNSPRDPPITRSRGNTRERRNTNDDTDSFVQTNGVVAVEMAKIDLNDERSAEELK